MSGTWRVTLAGGPFAGAEVEAECGLVFVAVLGGGPRSVLTAADLDAIGTGPAAECYSRDLGPDADPFVYVWRPRDVVPAEGLPFRWGGDPG